MLKVRATQSGQFHNRLYHAGDQFIIQPTRAPAYEPHLGSDNKQLVIGGRPQFTTKQIVKDGVPQFVVVTEDQQFAPEWMEKVVDAKPAVPVAPKPAVPVPPVPPVKPVVPVVAAPAPKVKGPAEDAEGNLV